jgi:hypothetical protein
MNSAATSRSKSHPRSEQPPPPRDPADGSTSTVETFQNPLAASVDLGTGVLGAAPPPPQSDPEGTAQIITEAANMLVAIKWEKPLTDGEREALQADLAAVLGKYDCPDLPFHEEFKLTMTVGGIVFRRAANVPEGEEQTPPATSRDSRGPATTTKEAPRDNAGHRKEGQREISLAPQNFFASASPEVRDLLP